MKYSQSIIGEAGQLQDGQAAAAAEDEEEEEDGVDDDDQNVAVDPTHLDPYLQELSDTQFNSQVFIFELAAHLFMPLTVLILMWWQEGRLYLDNRAFTKFRDFAFFVQWAIYGTFIYLCVLYFHVRPVNYSFSELLLLMALMVVRQVVIATKFAYVSPLEYREMLVLVESD